MIVSKNSVRIIQLSSTIMHRLTRAFDYHQLSWTITRRLTGALKGQINWSRNKNSCCGLNKIVAKSRAQVNYDSEFFVILFGTDRMNFSEFFVILFGTDGHERVIVVAYSAGVSFNTDRHKHTG